MLASADRGELPAVRAVGPCPSQRRGGEHPLLVTASRLMTATGPLFLTTVIVHPGRLRSPRRDLELKLFATWPRSPIGFSVLFALCGIGHPAIVTSLRVRGPQATSPPPTSARLPRGDGHPWQQPALRLALAQLKTAPSVRPGGGVFSFNPSRARPAYIPTERVLGAPAGRHLPCCSSPPRDDGEVATL